MISPLLAILLAATAVQDRPALGMQVGRMHPDFLLPTIDGKEYGNLSQFRGKKVLLINFASW